MKKIKDFYFKKAKKENHLARSIYKLEEIDKKYHMFKRGQSVIDLGCSPGSWLEYALSKIGKNGVIFGIDLKEVKKQFPQNVKVIKGDIYDYENFKQTIKKTSILPDKFDIVISDIAPNTSGQKDIDAYRSFELCVQGLKVCEQFLKTGGHFITKIFMGEDFKTFLDAIKSSFEKHKVYKPKSSRSESVEVYVIGWNKKENMVIDSLV
jgi:23S rRNA (uridine2552-2'-O)-methyltransferase